MRIIILIFIFSISLSTFADDEVLTSSDLLMAQQWLDKNGGKQWKLLYDEIDGKKYEWIITKKSLDDSIYVSFVAGKEIDNDGRVIGGVITWSDQFFTLVIDKKTYKLKRVDIGG